MSSFLMETRKLTSTVEEEKSSNSEEKEDEDGEEEHHSCECNDGSVRHVFEFDEKRK